jgi:hypothetical protein
VSSNFVTDVVEGSDGFAIRKMASSVKGSIDFASIGIGVLAGNLSDSLEGDAISVVIVLQ